ncbi:MAG: orotate phosphoribosyltransferase [Clostridia bacterium]|nr:orotate phosphoribosyltransferase [Clostridia bacterium]
MAIQTFSYPTSKSNIKLRVARGHFVTNHSHINYYIDLTMTKHRLSEAREAAVELARNFRSSTVVDTILCLDGTELIGACMANELTESGIMSMNQHQTIYVVTPEHTHGSQLLFRENTAPMIAGKNVVILAASVTTGYTVQAAIDAVRYYGGTTSGVCSIFTCVNEVGGYPVNHIFNTDMLDDYESKPAHECPLCKAGAKLDAMVNSFGFSIL